MNQASHQPSRALVPRAGDLVLTPSGRLAAVVKEVEDGRLLLRYVRGMDGGVTLQPSLVTVVTVVTPPSRRQNHAKSS